MIKALIGILLLIVAVCLFFYVGIYLCLYQGIVHTIDGFKTDASTGYIVKWVLIAFFFETLGGLAVVVPAVVGYVLLLDD